MSLCDYKALKTHIKSPFEIVKLPDILTSIIKRKRAIGLPTDSVINLLCMGVKDKMKGMFKIFNILGMIYN